MSEQFWRRYLFAAIAPVTVLAALIMSLSNDDTWSAIAYTAWIVVVAPWAWAIVTRRARL